MTNEKKKSKGPQDRNSNYQMKNGNSLSKKNKKSKTGKLGETKSVSAAKSGEQKGLISGISSSISSATNSITRMLKHK